jgi:small redox-active disulfide protein 2
MAAPFCGGEDSRSGEDPVSRWSHEILGGDDRMKIQVLGTGCPKCNKTYENVRQALAEAGVEAAVEKVEDLKSIMEFNVMMTPAVAIDGEVKVSGKVPSVEEIKGLIS